MIFHGVMDDDDKFTDCYYDTFFFHVKSADFQRTETLPTVIHTERLERLGFLHPVVYLVANEALIYSGHVEAHQLLRDGSKQLSE